MFINILFYKNRELLMKNIFLKLYLKFIVYFFIFLYVCLGWKGIFEEFEFNNRV